MRKLTYFIIFASVLIIAFIPQSVFVAAAPEWNLVFEDNFDGTAINKDDWWVFNSDNGNKNGHNGNGFRMASAVNVNNGILTITADMGTVKGQYDVVTGHIMHKKYYAYGKYEFRVRCDADPTSTTSGVVLTWPGDDVGWPKGGENDIYETSTSSTRNNFETNLHYGTGTNQNTDAHINYRHNFDAKVWHDIIFIWKPGRIEVYVDGVLSYSTDNLRAIPDVKHAFAIQLDTIFGGRTLTQPVKLQVDYVRIYQDTNLVTNEGFESKSNAFWNCYGTHSITSINSSEGKYAIELDADSGAEQTIVDLSPNTIYVLSGDVKTEKTDGVISFGVKNYGGNELKESTSTTVYSKKTIEFTTGPQNTQATVFFYRNTEGTGKGYGDNVALYLKSNDDFSDINDSPISKAPDYTDSSNVVLYEDCDTVPDFAPVECRSDGMTLNVPAGIKFDDIKVPKNASVEFDITSNNFNAIQINMRKPIGEKTGGYLFSYGEFNKIGLSNLTGYAGVRIARDDGSGYYFHCNPYSFEGANRGNGKYQLTDADGLKKHHVKFVTFEDKLIIYFDYEKVYAVIDNSYNSNDVSYCLSIQSLTGTGAEGCSFNLDNLLIKKVNRSDFVGSQNEIMNEAYNVSEPFYAIDRNIDVIQDVGGVSNYRLKMFDSWARTQDIYTPKNFTLEYELGYSGNIVTVDGSGLPSGFRVDVRKNEKDANGTKLYRVYYFPDIKAGTGSFKVILTNVTDSNGTGSETEEYTVSETKTSYALPVAGTAPLKIEVIDDIINVYYNNTLALTHTIKATECLSDAKNYRMAMCSRGANQYGSSKSYFTVDNLKINSIEDASNLWFDELSFYREDESVITDAKMFVPGTYKLQTNAYNTNALIMCNTYMALYDGDRLIKVIPKSVIIPSNRDKYTVRSTVTLTADDIKYSNFNIKGFIWNSKMSPLVNELQLK